MKKLVHITQFYPETPEVVFDTCLDPSRVKEWFMSNTDSEVISAHIEPIIGGSFSIIELTSDNKKIEHSGKYLYISRPNWIVFTLEVPEIFPGSTEVSINIRKEDGGSMLIYHQTGIDESIGNTWKRKMDQLAEAVDKK